MNQLDFDGLYDRKNSLDDVSSVQDIDIFVKYRYNIQIWYETMRLTYLERHLIFFQIYYVYYEEY